MHLYSYIVARDKGFAPNPFHGALTLACCKPRIRQRAQVGDLIVGISSRASGHRLVYAMVVDEVLTFAEYWVDARFHAKKPKWHAPRETRVGDNCYQPLHDGAWRQHRCMHSLPGGAEDHVKMAKDLGGRHVLVGHRFWYFGADAISLPSDLRFLVTGRGHRTMDDPQTLRSVSAFLAASPAGLCGMPAE